MKETHLCGNNATFSHYYEISVLELVTLRLL
jgi:hypothetical protein